ncbi:uncharacterized protein SPPG_03552 [Spizellomyces punctatus DAOM BR117]|uniref:Uncharacterized protein n=1 Tax=Spizellomyces punctatus (strain DAOM BR117) TaxID=645134 RepID=A0A0L0HLS3_SPIPD|nr:uncharacterized protein SPPG_03552 [Spizellomyces punctatus DAOM BR117]KND01759.1 hypothetical protein SPPG_03552 [Spizellomyces punctatus DAOM BR117]|eukprot:XP_016609798.1 hypothetical protein SPPG_03552 [Spizellomyces punctatus DAOM BR117]
MSSSMSSSTQPPTTSPPSTIQTLPTQSTSLIQQSTPTPTQSQKRTPDVLEEDTYVESLSKIIQRDFFPHLKRIKLQNELLDAVQNGEYGVVRVLGDELNQVDRGDIQTSITDTAEKDTIPVNTNMSLDAFQSRYTSEDNASFNNMITRINDDKRKKYSWIYDKETRVLQLGTTPDNEKEAKRIQQWKYAAKNSLMYYPSVDGSTAIETGRGEPKAISHDSTRFPSNTNTSDTTTMERQKTQDVWRDLAKATPGLLPQNSPNVNGYSFVPSTPVLNDTIDPSALLTWGTVEGTPLLMDGKGFSMPPTPRREIIGKKLAEKANKGKRPDFFGQPKTPLREPTRSELLSPAARHLLSKSKKSGDSQLRASYASPRGSSPWIGKTGTPRQRGQTPKTPLKTLMDGKRSITDGLVNL